MENQIEPLKPGIPAFDHKEAEADDCGLPENPIYANYPKYLWRRTNDGFHSATESVENARKNKTAD